MKKLLFALFASLSLLFAGTALAAAHAVTTYEVPLSSVTIPAECTGTYTHAFNAPAGVVVTGTSANDIIFAGDASSVHAGAGDDCIVVTARASVKGEAGNDILVSRNGQNNLDGGVGTDTAYYFVQSDSVHAVDILVAQ